MHQKIQSTLELANLIRVRMLLVPLTDIYLSLLSAVMFIALVL